MTWRRVLLDKLKNTFLSQYIYHESSLWSFYYVFKSHQVLTLQRWAPKLRRIYCVAPNFVEQIYCLGAQFYGNFLQE
jgi:hypothetical protein